MKTSNPIFKAGLTLVVATAMVSCTHDFVEVNTNPNTMVVGDLNPYGMFEATFYSFGNTYTTGAYTYCNELAQFTAASSTTNNIHRYNIPNSNIDNVWNAYAQYAANANHMIQQGEKKEEAAAVAVAKTLKVLFLSVSTDIFGDIPCSEAFKGSEGITTPVFDSQMDVYLYFFRELEEANEIYAGNPAFAKPTIDLMYKGDMTLWRKFNNSLYMRLLMRVSGRPEMNAAEKLQSIVNNPSKYPVISSNAENATIRNTGIDPYYNTYRPSEMTKSSFASHYLTNHFINMCQLTGEYSEDDPRLATMAMKPSADSDWLGVNGGGTISEMKEEVDYASYLNYQVLVRDAAPVWILDYSEIQFILAEAALKGYISGGENASRTYYEKALRASCEKWAPLVQYSTRKYEITEDRINAFINGHLAGWDNHSDKEELIANQKYLSLFWVGFEAYNEVRRTGYPILKIGNGCSFNNYEFPQRFVYPINTVGSNPANVKVALERMGGDNTMRTPVWWSYKAINGTFTAIKPTSI